MMDDPAIKPPWRAYCLTLELQADTREDMAHELVNIAHQIERDELTTGVSGGPSSGCIYELLSNPEQTHEKWFAEVKDYLSRQREAAEIGKRSDGEGV